MPRTMSREKFKTFQDVFDRFTFANLFKLERYFDFESLSPISIGKESNVFSAVARVGNAEKVAIKIHRLETSDFNTMYSYIRADPRFSGLKKRRREVIFAWAQREFRNLMVARECSVRAPSPIAFLKNIIIMEFIGNNDAAQKVKDALPRQPDRFFGSVVELMRRYYQAGFVHGDLSKFNILNYRESPVFIDFSQATPLKDPNSEALLRRDVKNVLDFFSKFGIEQDTEKTLRKITK
ncbi:serine protein kinase RIO [Candidatus Woesearchaeota archaeon]|nr:serine protein kinase RIO [Candidatus Woesearchaeota archaeon]